MPRRRINRVSLCASPDETLPYGPLNTSTSSERRLRFAVYCVVVVAASTAHSDIDVVSLCVFYRIYHGECSEELFNLIPAAEFHLRTTRHNAVFFHAFFHVLQSCGMSFPLRCFPDDTTWVPSKKARTPSLKAGNAPVVPLVLQEIVGVGDHLTPGDPYYFSIKKNDNYKSLEAVRR
ncbi:unnamed protein product [Leptidea sinapis]|uniref:Uncharacterized protein n=1 Tax=Leptidea sinapis TaxID=189913 RepID=A0A5E4Q3U4_9NEOP|nr:unnamed protein product [Leptidea sinapis]